MSDFSPLAIPATPTWQALQASWATTPPAGLAPCPSLALIEVQGEDAPTFLQGQLTQDHVLQPVGTWRHSAYCSPKGRMLASFLVAKVEATRFQLLCAQDVAAGIAKRLSMFVLRAKVKVTHQPDALLQGLVGEAGLSWAAPGVQPPEFPDTDKPVRALPDGQGWAWVLPSVWGHARVLLSPAAAGAVSGVPAPALAESDWHLLSVLAAEPLIQAANADQFVPQTLNLEAIGGISFKKGCYTGQEVVARSQFRGTIKRRGLLVSAPMGLTPGQELFTPQDLANPAGRVVQVAPWPSGGTLALTELKLEAVAEALQDAAGNPVQLAGPLPYAWPLQD